ncbi:formimidoylglutamase [Legionella impletisoli]|uniref:Formimidoylglutamase n=1 Tax=Legionella impletisoli TaxID=343510 RepID=A0A917K150_9GAMM|nr:formimidoylglutamase [Legionella impletisoli]GGI92959.1 formimidoylglutamase [Legionella impletisoli]
MLKDLKHYTPPDPSLWQGREDSLPGERYFQHVEWVNIQNQDLPIELKTVLLGFASDEGIRRNLGRVGAKLGPDAIRTQLAKLACHEDHTLIDVGNIFCEQGDLESAQAELTKLISYCQQQRKFTIALGGGHEIAWPHYRGLAECFPKLGIINFDAHFDIRPLVNHQSSSGTPFAEIKAHCEQKERPFDYCCLGIQRAANTKSLFDRANEWNISYLTAEQINQESLAWQMAFLDDFIIRHEYLYVSICLDVFDECYAPGVSAPQVIGINPWQALSLLKYIKQTGKVISLDIAELSPPFDERQKTARLAAIFLTELLNLTNEGR